MIDLHDGELTCTWIDDEVVFITSKMNGLTFCIPCEDYLKFVKELKIAAVKIADMEREEFSKN